tara:strand:- start:1320 stop:1946 length:627 start_codon:yes stop_codon:yes gene_type:complete
MNYIYTLDDLCYEIDNKSIINKISCSIEFNKVTNIQGANGAGKTTLLKLIYGLYEPSSGVITRHFDSQKMKQSYLFQNSILLNRSIKDNLNHTLYCQDIEKINWNNIILKTAREFNLDHILQLDVKTLSGGEFQLLTILRSILNYPNILFLDEPTNNLDLRNIEIIVNIIRSFQKQGNTILLVSHDRNLLDMIEYDQISINSGEIIND